MNSLVAGDLRIDRADRDSTIVLDWRGRSNDRDPAKSISPYVHSVYESAATSNQAVEMRFDNIEHFNSSTITVLIKFIQEARTRRIKLVIVYNAALKWQKLSFDALRIFANDDQLSLRAV